MYRRAAVILACCLFASGCASTGAGGASGETPEKPEGHLAESEVQRTMARHEQEFRACYERVLRRRPGADGRVVLEWTVDREGEVGDVRVQSNDFERRRIVRCLSSVVRTLEFARPEGGAARVSHRFEFGGPGIGP